MVNQEMDKRVKVSFTTGHKQKLSSNKRRTTRERNGLLLIIGQKYKTAEFSGTVNRQMDKKGAKRIDGVLIT